MATEKPALTVNPMPAFTREVVSEGGPRVRSGYQTVGRISGEGLMLSFADDGAVVALVRSPSGDIAWEKVDMTDFWANAEVIKLQPRPPYEASLPRFGEPPWETFGSQSPAQAPALAPGAIRRALGRLIAKVRALGRQRPAA